MKLQVVELPSVVVGENVETPFMVVLSEVDEPAPDPEVLSRAADRIGARGFLVSGEAVEVLPSVVQ
ncbi:hypothetical protein LO762_16490 [Actinocorallia sp. API 0066]|uniref:hypothetical protein n=1 Tax=Actinocorallia sp. API 0066 TaxID=2896846 RepID=UPI001E2F59C3|nr:hypothetical protein [Actinocorallia sp. API 0066]MCD0450777.1 hypothetical protein [Actinocorallia sp. API 0066]